MCTLNFKIPKVIDIPIDIGRLSICDFLLMVTVAVLLTVCKIFSRIELENRHFAHCILIVDPLAEERPTISK